MTCSSLKDTIQQNEQEKTIACDKCGARIDHISEKCPECGEILRDRMDPHVRGRIEKIMKKRSYPKWLFPYLPLAALAVLDIVEIALNAIHGPGCWGLQGGGKTNSLVVVALAVVFLVTAILALLSSGNIFRFLIRVFAVSLGLLSIVAAYISGCWQLFTSAHHQGPENLLIIAAFNFGIIVIIVSSWIKPKW